MPKSASDSLILYQVQLKIQWDTKTYRLVKQSTSKLRFSNNSLASQGNYHVFKKKNHKCHGAAENNVTVFPGRREEQRNSEA